jgi:hypothetical protein
MALFEDLGSPSLEAFALLLCKNGCENWVWMRNNACLTSEGVDTKEECPRCKHTKRIGDFTSRNGGWSKVVNSPCKNHLHKRVKEDRDGDNGSFGKVCKEHRAQMSRKGRKRRLKKGGPCEQFTVSNDLDKPWSAALFATEA